MSKKIEVIVLLAHHLCDKKEKEITDRWLVRFCGDWQVTKQPDCAHMPLFCF